MKEITVTKDNFDAEVRESAVPAMLDFWAPWCGPCRMVAPLLEEIAAERNDVKICKINVDEEPELAASFAVSSIPTLVVVKSGKITSVAVGYREKEDIEAMFNEE